LEVAALRGSRCSCCSPRHSGTRRDFIPRRFRRWPIALEVRDDAPREAARAAPRRSRRLDARPRRATRAGVPGTWAASRAHLDRRRAHRRASWLSRRLAETALHSPRWDPARGKPRGGNDNFAVAQMIGDAKLVAAWAEVFARHGASVRNASVEKVLIGRVGKTAELAPLAADPAAAGKRLPFDAILWLDRKDKAVKASVLLAPPRAASSSHRAAARVWKWRPCCARPITSHRTTSTPRTAPRCSTASRARAGALRRTEPVRGSGERHGRELAAALLRRRNRHLHPARLARHDRQRLRAAQLRDDTGMVLLAAAEIGGFAVLLAGFALTQFS